MRLALSGVLALAVLFLGSVEPPNILVSDSLTAVTIFGFSGSAGCPLRMAMAVSVSSGHSCWALYSSSLTCHAGFLACGILRTAFDGFRIPPSALLFSLSLSEGGGEGQQRRCVSEGLLAQLFTLPLHAQRIAECSR
eukprot:s1426_g33.t1